MPLVKIAVEVDDGGAGWERAQPFESLIRQTAPAPRITRQPDDYHLMYTDGTTGLPKGVICHVSPWSTGLTAMFATNVLGLPAAPTTVDQLVATVQALRAKGVVPVVMPASPLMHD